MKTEIERRKPEGPLDYLSLAVTTFGVGYLPLMPGTFGSAVGVLIYLLAGLFFSAPFTYIVFGILAIDYHVDLLQVLTHSLVGVAFLLFCLLGISASGRSTELLGNSDPPQAVVDEVIGQLITFLFVPFGIGWPLVLAGFLLFRLFDIWKPYPIDYLQVLPGGIGVCADDILAGVYAGVCLSVIYAITLSL